MSAAAVALLLQSGANEAVGDDLGSTSLDAAGCNGKAPVARVHLRAGATWQ